MPHVLCFALLMLSGAVLADDAAWRPSARLLSDGADFSPGRCVIYRERGRSRSDPVYYLQGLISGSEIRQRHLGTCPVIPGKAELSRYSREEFVRHVLAHPCVSNPAAEGEQRIGIVRLRAQDWETPYERRAENLGRLYRGMFLDRKLEKNMEIELEADLLADCAS